MKNKIKWLHQSFGPSNWSSPNRFFWRRTSPHVSLLVNKHWEESFFEWYWLESFVKIGVIMLWNRILTENFSTSKKEKSHFMEFWWTDFFSQAWNAFEIMELKSNTCAKHWVQDSFSVLEYMLSHCLNIAQKKNKIKWNMIFYS